MVQCTKSGYAIQHSTLYGPVIFYLKYFVYSVFNKHGKGIYDFMDCNNLSNIAVLCGVYTLYF